MTRALSTVLLAATLALAGMKAASAQSCHSLSGLWRLDRSASLLGSGLSFNPTYAVDAIALTLAQHKDGHVDETWRLSGAHVNELDTFTIRPDGALHPTHLVSVLDTTPDAVEGRWLNCTLTVRALTHLFGQESWTDNSYIVDPDGRRLTIRQTSRSAIGDVERHLVFKKVEG